MAKKLTVEVDAETTKAKQKIQALATSGGSSALGGGGGSGLSPAADRAAKSLERASQGADRLSKSTLSGSSEIMRMSKVFGGMAIRMAAGYAAKGMEPGSTAQKATSAIGDIAGGAMSGAAFGPIGMIAGGLIGGISSLVSSISEANEAERERVQALKETAAANREQLDIMLESEKRTDEFRARLASMTDTTRSASERQRELQAELERLQERDKQNIQAMRDNSRVRDAGEEDAKYFSKNQREHAANRSEIETLKSALKSLGEEGKKSGSPFRESTAATDALSRIGGGSFGGDYAREQLAAAKETVTVLKSIDQKTNNGVGTWQ